MSAAGGPGSVLRATERVPARGFGGSPQVSERASAPRASSLRLVRSLRPELWRVLLVIAVAVLGVGLTTAGPWLLGRATNIVVFELAPSAESAQGAYTGGLETVGSILLLALGAYGVAALLAWLQGHLLIGVVQRTVARMRADVAAKVHRLPLPYVDAQPRGELLSRVTNDVDNVGQTLQQTLSQLITALLTVVATVAAMVWISPLLALVALATVPISVLLSRIVLKRSQGLFVEQWRRTGRLNALVEESFTGHELLTAYSRRSDVEAVFAQENDAMYDAAFRAQFVSNLIGPLMMLIGNLNFVAVAVLGGLRVASGSLSVGDVQAFVQYSRQFSQPLTQLAAIVSVVQSGVASAERVFELLDAPEERPETTPPVSGRALQATPGEVVFSDVCFRYDPDVPLLEDVSFAVHPGQTVAIVGPTGAGKTTLVNLLMRFYELRSGRILLDGVDIADLTRQELRSRTGMVLQDSWLCEGTIHDNIAYGRPDASEEEVLAAARATYVDRFVQALPDGYDTPINEDGGGLSSGERQLITIARAFLAAPALLILDEATSSVDTRTELLVQRAMKALRNDRTSFVIAHRLSTIRDADLILVLDAGRIVEQGDHISLLARGGAYARLYLAQSGAAGQAA